MSPKIFLPYRAEFGWVIMAHAPQVHHEIKQDIPAVVCCEAGNEALYPGAKAYEYVDRRIDCRRREHIERDWIDKEIIPDLAKKYGPAFEFVWPDQAAPRAYFIPRPHHQEERLPEVDVVICPRKRTYGPDKNWHHWQYISDLLDNAGLKVFAAGAPDSSDQAIATNTTCAWHLARPLDATIEAMNKAKIIVSTDAGLAHLAVLCGKPLLIISYRDRLVAPGTDDQGRPYWPIKIDRYQQANHQNTHLEIIPWSWDDPRKVADKTKELCHA